MNDPSVQPHRHGRPPAVRGGDSAESLGLTGTETFDITGVTALNDGPTPRTVTVTATAQNGHVTTFAAIVRIDTRARRTTTATAGSCSTSCGRSWGDQRRTGGLAAGPAAAFHRSVPEPRSPAGCWIVAWGVARPPRVAPVPTGLGLLVADHLAAQLTGLRQSYRSVPVNWPTRCPGPDG